MARSEWFDTPSTSTPLSAARLNDLDERAAQVEYLPINVKEYGAVGDGIVDDTAAFAAATAAALGVAPQYGRSLFIPGGDYVVGDWLVNNIGSRGMVIQGDGWRTKLTAKAGATRVLDLQQQRWLTVRDLMIDGRGLASKGVRVQAINALGDGESQGITFDHVRFMNCVTCVEIADPGTPDEADKNTYMSCQFNDSTVGIDIQSPNSQCNVAVNCTFDTVATGVKLYGGSFDMLGGTFSGGLGTEVCILIGVGSSAPEWLGLRGVITEQIAYDIDGNAQWPVNGVHLTQCILQGTTRTVRFGSGVGAGGSKQLSAHNCFFNGGNIELASDDSSFLDFHNRYSGTSVSRTGVNVAHQKLDLNGFTLLHGASGRIAIDPLFGVEMEELSSEPGAPAANRFRLYALDNGAGKTLMRARFPTGAVQTPAQEP